MSFYLKSAKISTGSIGLWSAWENERHNEILPCAAAWCADGFFSGLLMLAGALLFLKRVRGTCAIVNVLRHQLWYLLEHNLCPELI